MSVYTHHDGRVCRPFNKVYWHEVGLASPYICHRSHPPKEWEVADEESVLDCPPDFTGLRGCYQRCNEVQGDDDWVCTRIPGHTGRHAAGDGEHINAVW